MKVKPDDFDAGLRGYVLEKFIPSLQNPFSRFALGTVTGAGTLGLSMFGGADALRPLGAVGDDGMIDLDVLKKAVRAGFDATADGKLPVNRWGFALSLDKGDADGLFAYMEKAATPPTATDAGTGTAAA